MFIQFTTSISSSWRFSLLFLSLVITQYTVAQQWTVEQARQWSAQQPWVVGSNFIPSTAINQLEMWQAETFDTTTIDRELGYMEGIGMNTTRVFLHYLVWQQNWTGFRSRMDRYLQLADRHRIKTIFVLFDDCWNGSPQLGKQPDPIPGVHNSGWMQCPGDPAYKNTSLFTNFTNYTRDVLTYFKNDTRILLWDLYNEAGNGNKGTQSWPLVKIAFETGQQVRPSQPLSSCWWADQGPMDDWELDNSDVITFHMYGALDNTQNFVTSRLRPYNRPIICTEYMARGIGSTFQNHLAYFNSEGIGAINWGLVDGKTQTKFPWGSVQGAPEPNPWFHEVFHPNGTPYDAAEANLIRLYSTLSTNTAHTTLVPTSESIPQRWNYTFNMPPANWTQPSFDASAWSIGNGGFGNNTTVKWTTDDIWMCRKFQLPATLSQELLNALFLRISFDEEAEVYFNGVLAAKVTRFSVGYVNFPITRAALIALNPGAENTLAVHCHQTAGGQFIDVGIQTFYELSTLINTSKANAQTWSYTTTQPTGTWVQLTYAETNWLSGPGGFGIGVPNVTPHTAWNSPDIWLRKKFTGPKELPKDLLLNIYYDEDVEVYLNGTVIYSQKGYVQDYQNILLAQDQIKPLLTNATNVLAVHCHQTAGGQFIDAGLSVPVAPNSVKNNGMGLTGQYYNGKNFDSFVKLRTDTVVKFDWGFGAPDPLVKMDQFSARWSGSIQASITGMYTFYINSDNGRRLTIAGQTLIDQWKSDWNIDYSGKMFLTAGQKYPIFIEYYEEDGSANITFDWAQNAVQRIRVPAENLFPDYDIAPPEIVSGLEQDLTTPGVYVYPNPAEDLVTIDAGSGTIKHIAIYNLQGIKVYTSDKVFEGQKNLSLKMLGAGLYSLQLKGNDFETTQKIMIK